MKFKIGAACMLLLLLGFYLYSNNTTAQKLPEQTVLPEQQAEKPLLTIEEVRDIALSQTDSKTEDSQKQFEQNNQSKTSNSSTHLSSVDENQTEHPGYEVEDGVAVVEGDIVLGEPGSNQKYSGFTQPLMLWPKGVVPFFIQGDVENSGRIIQAISAFVDSGISFVPYTDQEDVLVFQNGSGNCKSYVGRVGGKQPLWVAPGCGSKELIHEIMHALGFIHEQNRNDRDSFIDIQWANIDEKAKVNFEKFPTEMMKASAGSPFDFQSIMIYPPSMFSKNGDTMIPKIEGKTISPSGSLSVSDVLRLNQLSKKY
jgi:hypothetical protein